MKLRKEENDEILEDSLEYKTALKSVIRCEIQNLLQKLAVETGEESIVITTNVSAGTYNHLGSCLGQEYLQDRGIVTVERLCENFTSFCQGIQNECVVIPTEPEPERHNSLATPSNSLSPFDTDAAVREAVTRQFTPLTKPINSHVRKRPPTKSPQDYPPLKKMNLTGSASPALVLDSVNKSIIDDCIKSDTSLVKEVCPAQEKKASPESKSNVPRIKVEPAEIIDDTNTNQHDAESKLDSPDGLNITSYEKSSEKGVIKNRRKNFIPLANIYKKFGSTTKSEQELASIDKPNSIVKNVFENSPVFKVSDLYPTNYDSEPPERVQINLPSNLAENFNSDDYSSTTENLVLSGYYDADVYPHYRHRQKHLLNKSEKKAFKEKPKEKAASPNGPASASAVVSDNPTMKTYESGGRLVYSCDVCKRELSHLTSYRRHMKLHTMERPHVCPICSKGFIRKYHCIDHLNKHHKGVRFDPESLRLLDLPGSYEIDEQQAYSPGDLNTSEYNYTLDQSLAGSEGDMSISDGIDQSASSMLSELAKSAARLNQSENATEKENHESSLLIGKENLSQSEEIRSEPNQPNHSQDDETKPEARNKKSMPTALAKIVAELRSAPKGKHRKELEQKSSSDIEMPFQEIPTHLLKYADIENWICLLCDESFSDQKSFQSHMIEHKSAEIVKCEKCPRGFISKEIYDEHLVIDHADEG